jgi:hypothetical protein
MREQSEWVHDPGLEFSVSPLHIVRSYPIMKGETN